MKLTEAQKKVITALQHGEKIHYMTGLYARCFYSRSFKNISWATIFKLEDLGLVVRGTGFINLTEYGKTIKI